ncbi:hypothetical protein [Frigoriglobus tundricola]|uniref:Uncharacterized protein n=1 Tax=Frigoriglobus tundricola TaxID=2774151 RepID=A0A6M5YR30_9BACT|nr:hypothetical protein [Frigoriglobus tundricola]QJW96429.1 hypothetical protein FTUN_3986 [Frigoriglobus tundricola]
MAYSEFDLADVATKLGVTVADHPDLFAGVPGAPLSAPVQGLLRLYFPLAIANGTEKARSELLIAPVLADAREQLGRRVSLFSGWDFVVDKAKGLNGVCDYILCRSPQQEFITAPVAVIVEAKNENIKGGLGQCGAEMVAARMFNERSGTGTAPVFGCVTSGNVWRFLRLFGNELHIDQNEYYLTTQPEAIVGILFHILRDPATSSGQAA